MLRDIIASKSKTFITFCFCFLAGIVIGSLHNKRVDFVIVYLAVFVLLGQIVVFKNNKMVLFTVYCLLFTSIGFFRYSFALPPADFELPKGSQKFTAYVSAEADVRQDGVRYIVKPVGYELLAMDQVYFKSSLYPRYYYGDVLELECPFYRPEAFDNFRYDMFMAVKDVYVICNNPMIVKVGEGRGNGIFTGILEFKDKVSGLVNQLWHEPYAGFMGGLLYGYRGGLGDLNEKFNRTGVTHIIAISGYNIGLITKFILILLPFAYIKRQYAFWIVSFLILIFVLFAGAGASVVRAGVMGFLILLAHSMGRVRRVGNAMALTAVLMTLHNPFVLVWDAGFQLSFIATIGLVYLAPIFDEKIQFSNSASSIVTATLAAVISTLPLILYQFGRLSTVAVVVNILILWVIPWIMLGGFLSVIAGLIYFPMSEILAWVSWVPMRYVTAVVEWFSALPFASINLQIPLSATLVIYFLYIYKHKRYVNRRAQEATSQVEILSIR